MSDPVIVRDSEQRRYKLMLGDAEAGFLDYDPVGDSSLLIKHTEVAREREGQGLGSRLLRHVLDEMRGEGKTIIPICPYALAFIRRHPEYHDLVRADFRRTL